MESHNNLCTSPPQTNIIRLLHFQPKHRGHPLYGLEPAKRHDLGAARDGAADDDRFYIALFSSLEQTHCAFVTCDCSLKHCLDLTWLVPRETAAVPARSVYTVQPCTSLHYFMKSHIRRVHTCLAVTCHLHFWQNDRGLLRATVVTRGCGTDTEIWFSTES